MPDSGLADELNTNRAPEAGEQFRHHKSRAGRRLAWACALGSIAALVGLGSIHPFGDPRVQTAGGSLLRVANMPAQARAVLIEKCADCHSSETRWPLYARVAPGSWLIDRDIIEARRQLDLSRWDEFPPETREQLEAKIIQAVKNGSMPPLQYLVLHWGARPSSADFQALSAMNKKASEETVGGLPDVEHGKTVFDKRCTGCHTMARNGEGPKLAGVFGRKAGSVAQFEYSPALQKSGLTWSEATLDKWLADPDTLVPGTTMEFRVAKAIERRDLIAYLKR